MGKKILERIDIENLITNLRGEVGTVIESWTLLREYHILTNQLTSNMSHSQYKENLRNSDFKKRHIIKKKLTDDIISKLSELAQETNNTLNFYLATQKITNLDSEFKDYKMYIIKNKFKARRNEFISHKNLPLKWSGHKAAYSIPYVIIVKAIVKAIILMKEIDNIYIGKNANLNWQILRASRYNYEVAARARYMDMSFIK
ncbi:hypothetical protein SAMN04488007_2435 [Maribacter aquivivus]|uniref:HEPN AbiU2-like domain-containing protein n=1 Tax=Maribacter aquivivus TaxID=228958 RepID=A0A1M6QQD5_9FLAO|nr:hypothetical protein [Maribacter aquivivus]SHK22499.1 hypothetical protein SAMN04488007_2435 [Maribacter aquivivus]